MLICANGVPFFRHDWFWPSRRMDFLSTFELSTSGWSPLGFGQPNANPSGYLIAPLILLLGFVFGPLLGLFIYFCGIGGLCAWGGIRLFKDLTAEKPDGITAFCVVSLLLFNPWVYNEVVAGHSYMILAFAATVGLLSEMLRPDCSQTRLAFLLALTVQQIQFFLFAMAALTLFGALYRKWVAAVTGMIVFLPMAFGILLFRNSVAATRIALSWEVNQSLGLADALRLSGYFTHYAAAFDGGAQVALWIVFGCALISSVLALFNRKLRRIAACASVVGLFALAAALGVNGPFGTPFASLVLHFPPIGIFRELYDLVAYLLLSYIILVILLLRIIPHTRWLLASSGLILMLVWILSPPARFWSDGLTVPRPVIYANTNQRFALAPAFQPLQFNGVGSGADPDAIPRANGSVPLNDYIVKFPASTALASFERYGTTEDLRGLGVGYVYFRPWLRTDEGALRQQGGVSLIERQHAARVLQVTNPFPFVSLLSLPRLASVPGRFSAGRVLFSDLQKIAVSALPKELRFRATVRAIPFSKDNVDYRTDWVDARAVFLRHPLLGQPYGGAYTEGSQQSLQIPNARYVLVKIRGSLVSNTGLRWQGNAKFHWIAVRGAEALRCYGKCLVALAADRIPMDLPDGSQKQSVFALSAHQWFPWLVTANAPSGGAGVLRLNNSYNSTWLALSQGKALTHFRIDGVANAWLVTTSKRPQSFVMVNKVALLQCVLEVFGFLWVIGIALAALRRRRAAFVR